ncbi:MAG: hypothetical protein PSX71_08705 [bacterium]|nr:hypothetical protein [bacterium]
MTDAQHPFCSRCNSHPHISMFEKVMPDGSTRVMKICNRCRANAFVVAARHKAKKASGTADVVIVIDARPESLGVLNRRW